MKKVKEGKKKGMPAREGKRAEKGNKERQVNQISPKEDRKYWP